MATLSPGPSPARGRGEQSQRDACTEMRPSTRTRERGVAASNPR